MKDLTKLEVSLIKDIIFTILIVIVSIPLWLLMGENMNNLKVVNNTKYIRYEFLNNASHDINTLSDEDALRNCETQDIIVYNNSKTVDNYSLLLKIEKSDIDLSTLKVNVNYDVKYLQNYYSFADEQYYYFVLDSNSLNGNSKKYSISIWDSALNNSDITYEYSVM